MRVLILALVPLLAGCGSSILGDDPATAIAVSVRKSPIQPVPREGEDNSAPVAGALVRVRAEGGGQLDRRTAADGTVRVPLAPGRYEVEVRECPGALALPPPAAVSVTRGHEEALTLMCDTGIR